MARLMRLAYEEGKDSDKAQYRLLLDFGKQVLSAMKLESDLAVEKRLDAIEAALSALGKK
jgi:hypothetical protein